MNLYLTHGEYHDPDSRYLSHYCGLPVRAATETDALARTNRELSAYRGRATGVRPTDRMPALDMASDFARGLAARLTT